MASAATESFNIPGQSEEIKTLNHLTCLNCLRHKEEICALQKKKKIKLEKELTSLYAELVKAREKQDTSDKVIHDKEKSGVDKDKGAEAMNTPKTGDIIADVANLKLGDISGTSLSSETTSLPPGPHPRSPQDLPASVEVIAELPLLTSAHPPPQISPPDVPPPPGSTLLAPDMSTECGTIPKTSGTPPDPTASVEVVAELPLLTSIHTPPQMSPPDVLPPPSGSPLLTPDMSTECGTIPKTSGPPPDKKQRKKKILDKSQESEMKVNMDASKSENKMPVTKLTEEIKKLEDILIKETRVLMFFNHDVLSMKTLVLDVSKCKDALLSKRVAKFKNNDEKLSNFKREVAILKGFVTEFAPQTFNNILFNFPNYEIIPLICTSVEKKRDEIKSLGISINEILIQCNNLSIFFEKCEEKYANHSILIGFKKCILDLDMLMKVYQDKLLNYNTFFNIFN